MREWQVSVRDTSNVLLRVIRQVPVVGLHSVQTAKTAALVSRKLGMNPGKIMIMYLIGALHDVGLMIPSLRKEYESFPKDKGILEMIKHEDLMKSHGPVGAKIVGSVPILEDFSTVVEHHHTPAYELDIDELHVMANALNAANMMSIKLLEHDNRGDREFFEDFESHIKSHKVEYFPDVREAAVESAAEEAMMMLASDEDPHWDDFVGIDSSLDLSSFLSFLNLMDYLVDSMAEETQHHSARVAFLSRELAKELLTEAESVGVYIAGRMHDLGKIYLPSEIVARRDDSDYDFHLHVIYTYKLFDCFRSFQNVVSWAVTHHERLDGSGYPWHLKASDLSLPARIIQVADEYVTLVERGVEDPLKVIEGMVKEGKHDKDVVEVLRGMVRNGYDVLEYYDVIDMYIREVESGGGPKDFV